MKKISLFQVIVSACALIITLSIFYYLVIFLPNYQNKKLELSKTEYGDENFVNDSWSKNELTKDLDGDGIVELMVIDGPHGS